MSPQSFGSLSSSPTAVTLMSSTASSRSTGELLGASLHRRPIRGAAVTAAWSAHQGSAFSNKLFLNQVTLEDLTSNVGAVGIDTTGAQGGDTGVETPAGVAVIVSESIYRRY